MLLALKPFMFIYIHIESCIDYDMQMWLCEIDLHFLTVFLEGGLMRTTQQQ